MLTYKITGDVQRLRVPRAVEPGQADGLWTHTCFEAFFSEPGAVAYHEFNFSPSAQWAHYRFSDERLRDECAANLSEPVVRTALPADDRLELTALVAATPTPETASALLCAPTAVLELADGSLSYWAALHPAPYPDFHARAGWSTPQRWTIL